jgi:hypothetical protein
MQTMSSTLMALFSDSRAEMTLESWQALMLCAPVCTVVFPAGHVSQVVSAVAPVWLEYVPSGHLWHVVFT